MMSLLSGFLRSKIAQTPNDGPDRYVVARQKMRAAEMPEGAQLVHRKIAGSRVTVKNRRVYGNVRSLTANWPEAGLQEWERYKMICVMAGEIDFQVGHYAIQGGEGLYLIIPPGTPEPDGFRTFYTSGNYCDVLSIISHPHAVQCFLSRDERRRGGIECLENYLFENNGLAMMFRLLVEEIIGARKNSGSISSELLSAFWLSLQREFDEGNYIRPGPVGLPMESNRGKEGFEAALFQHIQTHLSEPLCLENVARALYLSRAQFVRRMRQETGKTFVQFLTDYRIGEAKLLLRDSNWTVSAISGFLGFKTPTYFQAVFRKATNQTPTQYRTSSRKKS